MDTDNVFLDSPCALGLFSSPVIFYHSSVKDASGRTEVRNAKDAIEAYKNITDAINAAEAAANEAKEAADNALNVSNISHFFFGIIKFINNR